jgi:hypothetical protein
MPTSLHRPLHGRDQLAKLPVLVVLMLVSLAMWLSLALVVRELLS